jgi:hypothetical protein
MDPLVKFALLPGMSKSLTESFAQDRATIEKSGKLGASERSITRRIALIREMENSVTQSARIPSPRASAFALHDVAGAYDDLTAGLRAIPAPRGLRPRDRQAYDRMLAKLTAPYEHKARSVREKEFQVTSQALVAKAVDVSDLGWKNASLDTGSSEDIFKARWAQALSSGNWPQVGYFMQQAEKKKILSKSEMSNARAVAFGMAGTELTKEGS